MILRRNLLKKAAKASKLASRIHRCAQFLYRIINCTMYLDSTHSYLSAAPPAPGLGLGVGLRLTSAKEGSNSSLVSQITDTKGGLRVSKPALVPV